MTRITQKDLERLVDHLNDITGSPMKPWENGKANIGNYHLYYAYGAVALHRMANEGGGIQCPIGLSTKRELYGRLNSFIDGIQFKG